MILKTRYLGLELSSPLVAAPSPLSESIESIKRLEAAGAGAVVLYSLFEEQLTLGDEMLVRLMAGEGSYAEAISQLPEHGRMHVGPLRYLEHIQKAKRAVQIPIIASVNGAPNLLWTHYARLIEQAGADALELNLYYIPDDPKETPEALEQRYLSVVGAIRARLHIPVAVKLQPYFTNVSNFAKQLEGCGVDGLVLFNRFYQPDFDLETGKLRYGPRLSPGDILGLRIRWMEILSRQVNADLAITGGVYSGEDALKAIAKGADVVMLCSALLRGGIERIALIEEQMKTWLHGHDWESISNFRGSLVRSENTQGPTIERAQYLRNLDTFDLPRSGDSK